MSNSVIQILLFLVFLIVQASGAAPRLAKQGCNETCGNITIPFPFEIGAMCFIDEWYEIDCQQSNMIPTLKKIGLPVLNISLPNYDGSMNGMISVGLPLIYSNASCGNDGYDVPVSLKGSQFVFSKTWNVFTSVGCNTLATVNSTESVVVGCRSKCVGTNTNISLHNACSGRDGCCHTTLPFNLQGISVDLKEEGGHQGCKYAFLADRSWFLRSNFAGLYDFRLTDTVPVVLEWGIPNNTKDALELIRQDCAISRSSYAKPFTCNTYDLYGLYGYRSEMPFTQCYCGRGMVVTPILLEDAKILTNVKIQISAPAGTCVDKLGNYDCVDGRKTAKETAKFIVIDK